jgi:DNA-binding beta-propeller fold protein YncE
MNERKAVEGMSGSARMRSRTIAVVAVAVLATLLIPGTALAADPVLTRTLGGPLHAEMYPSGLEVGTDGTIVIADTGNNQIAKYSAAGVQLWRIGQWGAGTNEFDNPRDIAIDASNNIYVADTRNSRIVKLSPSGAWLGTYGGTTGDLINYELGVTIHGNILYVADTGRKKVRRIDISGGGWVELPAVVADPDGGQYADSGCRNLKGIRDADADSAGNVYVTGYLTNDIAKFDPSGNCVDWGVTGTGPGQFRTPYGVRVAVDPVVGGEVLFVADGLNSRVQEFTLTGTYITEMGVFGDPDVPGTVSAVRRVAAVNDGSGAIWLADLWGNRIERYTRGPSGYTYAQTIGAVMPPEDDTHVFQEPRQVAVGADGVVNVMDTVHHRIVRMDRNGHILSICGSRATEGAELGKFNWPRGLAIDNATGQLWVADTKQNRIQIVDPNCTGLEFIGDFYGGAAANQFDWPYGVAIRQTDRIAFVADTQNNRIKTYNVATRAAIALYGTKGTGFAQFKLPAGIAVSPVDGHIFVADSGNNRIKELSTTDGVTFTTVRNITVPALNDPEGVAVDPQGRIYIADSGNDRVVILDSNRVQIAIISGGLKHPSTIGIDPNGTFYVSDTYNDRVLAYRWPAPDTTLPTVTMTAPTQNQAYVGLSPITFSGTASDNVGVTIARVAIKNISTGQWWRSGNTWGAYQLQNATLGTPGGTSTTWSYTWTPPMTGSFSVLVESVDAAGNVAVPKPTRAFTVSNSAPDTTAPNGTVTVPALNQAFTHGTVVTSGQATDNVGVTKVNLAIKNRTTGQWWSGTTWQASFKWFAVATLLSPGGTSTGWQYAWSPPVGAGSYALQVRADDAAGNFDTTQPFVNFTVAA